MVGNSYSYLFQLFDKKYFAYAIDYFEELLFEIKNSLGSVFGCVGKVGVKDILEERVEWMHMEVLGCWKTVKVVNGYALLKTVGRGRLSKVKLCQHVKNGNYYAMKIYCKNQLLKKRVRFGNHVDLNVYREMDILKIIKHDNIVQVYEIINDPKSTNIYIVMEFMSGGPLNDYKLSKPKMSEDTIRIYFKDLVRAVKYIHSMNIIHRDIKPENILLTGENIAKLSDFSVSEYNDGGECKVRTSEGTPAFMPPELCVPYETSPLGRPVDIWSLGVTLYCLVFGVYPFVGNNIASLYINIVHNALQFPHGMSVSDDLKCLMSEMLEKDPAKRITIEDIQHHRWLRRPRLLHLC